jgi:hypothetical protein
VVIFLHSINYLITVKKLQCDFFEAETQFLNISYISSIIYNRGAQAVYIAQCAKMCAAQPARMQMMQWPGM